MIHKQIMPRISESLAGFRTIVLFAVFCKIGAWSVMPIDFMSNQFLLLFSVNHLNYTSELNESSNYLAKNTRKKVTATGLEPRTT